MATGGEVRDEIVLNIDLAPTIIAAAGFDIPDVIQGEDLSQLYLSDDTPAWRDEFFYEHPTITYKSRAFFILEFPYQPKITLAMVNVTLFAQIIQTLYRFSFKKLVAAHQTNKHQKGISKCR